MRQKCKDITALLADEGRLREERRKRQDMRGRMGTLDDDFSHRNHQVVSGGSSGPYYNEDQELRKAIEESKKTAQQEARKRDDDL